jgi:hypothetical protein
MDEDGGFGEAMSDFEGSDSDAEVEVKPVDESPTTVEVVMSEIWPAAL